MKWQFVLKFLFAATALLTARVLPAQSTGMRYEVSINGESFTVEAGQSTKLNSQTKPGTSYQVAVRPAQYQRWQLNRLEFDYHLGFKIEDDHKAGARTATLKHPLGFALTITDLGAPLSKEGQQKALDLLRQTVEASFKAAGGRQIETAAAPPRKFGANEAIGLGIRYDDRAGVTQSCLIYLITGPRFTCSCITQYRENDEENVLSIVKPTLESLAPITAR